MPGDSVPEVARFNMVYYHEANGMDDAKLARWITAILARLDETNAPPWTDATADSERTGTMSTTDHAHAPWDDHDPECCDHTDVTNGICDDCGEQTGPIVVTVTLTGLPRHCPRCGAPAPDGQWGIGVHGNLLHVVCPLCFTAITPVRAVADAGSEERQP